MNTKDLPSTYGLDKNIVWAADRGMIDILDRTALLDLFDFTEPCRVRLCSDDELSIQFLPVDHKGKRAGAYCYVHGEVVYKETFAAAIIDFVNSFMTKSYDN